jgi:hypothetical protein
MNSLRLTGSKRWENVLWMASGLNDSSSFFYVAGADPLMVNFRIVQYLGGKFAVSPLSLPFTTEVLIFLCSLILRIDENRRIEADTSVVVCRWCGSELCLTAFAACNPALVGQI